MPRSDDGGNRKSFIRVAEMKYAPIFNATRHYEGYPRGPLHKLEKCSREAEETGVLPCIFRVRAASIVTYN